MLVVYKFFGGECTGEGDLKCGFHCVTIYFAVGDLTRRVGVCRNYKTCNKHVWFV